MKILDRLQIFDEVVKFGQPTIATDTIDGAICIILRAALMLDRRFILNQRHFQNDNRLDCQLIIEIIIKQSRRRNG